MIPLVQVFPLSCDSESKSRSYKPNRHQTLQFSSIIHHTTFTRSWIISHQMHVNVKDLCDKITSAGLSPFTLSTSLHYRLQQNTSSSLTEKNCKEMTVEITDILCYWDLDWRSSSFKLVKGCWVKWCTRPYGLCCLQETIQNLLCHAVPLFLSNDNSVSLFNGRKETE